MRFVTITVVFLASSLVQGRVCLFEELQSWACLLKVRVRIFPYFQAPPHYKAECAFLNSDLGMALESACADIFQAPPAQTNSDFQALRG